MNEGEGTVGDARGHGRVARNKEGKDERNVIN